MRGCICGPDLAVIALRIVKKGDAELEGVTDGERPRRRGPKRASYIRKVFALRKKDDVRKYVVKREVKKGDKTLYKSPKIQRLITERRIRRKKLVKRGKLDQYKKGKDERAKYERFSPSTSRRERLLTIKPKERLKSHQLPLPQQRLLPQLNKLPLQPSKPPHQLKPQQSRPPPSSRRSEILDSKVAPAT